MIVVLVVSLLVVLATACWLIGRRVTAADRAEALRCKAQADVELYRLRRRMDAKAFRHELHRDVRRARRELSQELEGHRAPWERED